MDDLQHVIIVGTGNEQFDEILKKDLEQHNIGQVVSKVPTRNVLVKRVMETSATMVIVGEDLIGNDDTDEEWEVIFGELRNISLQMRVIFICDRSEDDLFLARLTTYSIYDIFNDGSLPASYIEQLSKPPEFKHIQKFKKNIRKATEDKIQEQREREAEKIIKTGVVPQSEQQVIKTTISVYERLLIQPQLIVIASAYEGAGSSTFGKMFMEYLATLRLHVGLLESPFSKASWFDYINANPIVHELNNWKSWHQQVANDVPISSGHDITIRDVTYIPRGKQEELREWDVMRTAQLVGMARQIPILFYDLSSNLDDIREKLILRQASRIFFVTSFDPVRVNREFKRFEKMLENISISKIVLICNRSTDKLEKKYGAELRKAYNTEINFSIPFYESMLETSMDGTSIWDTFDDETKKSTEKLFYQMAAEIIGEDTLEKLRPDYKERGILGRLFRRK